MANKIAKGLFVENKKDEKKEEEQKIEAKKQEDLQELKQDKNERDELNNIETESNNNNNNNNINNSNNNINNINEENENKKLNTLKNDSTPSVSSFQFTSSETLSESHPTQISSEVSTSATTKKRELVEVIVTWTQNWLSLIAPLFGIFIALMILRNKKDSD